MKHRPAMEGVNNCKECEREKSEEHMQLLTAFGWSREKLENLADTEKKERDRCGYLYFPWLYQWSE